MANIHTTDLLRVYKLDCNCGGSETISAKTEEEAAALANDAGWRTKNGQTLCKDCFKRAGFNKDLASGYEPSADDDEVDTGGES